MERDLPSPKIQTLAPLNTKHFGNVPRNSFRGPHFSDVDATLFKDVYKKESLAFQVGAQAYNLFNHVNFGQPGNFASNLSTLGR